MFPVDECLTRSSVRAFALLCLSIFWGAIHYIWTQGLRGSGVSGQLGDRNV